MCLEGKGDRLWASPKSFSLFEQLIWLSNWLVIISKQSGASAGKETVWVVFLGDILFTSPERGQLSIWGNLKGKHSPDLGSDLSYCFTFLYLMWKAIINVVNPTPDLGMYLCSLQVKYIHTDQMFHLLLHKLCLMNTHSLFLHCSNLVHFTNSVNKTINNNPVSFVYG